MIIKILIIIINITYLTRNVAGQEIHKTNVVPVKVVQEPASYNYQINNAAQINLETHLIPNTKPSNFSGPLFLEALNGNCYNLTNERYRFEFCPFQNITQHETTALWNAYKGILGIWQEWKIENNTFEAMVYSNGDLCGNFSREALVYFHCGDHNQLLNVSEPSQCQYKIDFGTPLVCFEDAFKVYPTLPEELQQKWDVLETELHENLITKEGYKKYLGDIFLQAGIQSTKMKANKTLNLIEDSTDTFTTKILSTKNKVKEIEFADLDQCVSAYNRLKDEFKEWKSKGDRTTSKPND